MPIDIQQIGGSLILDGASQSGTADATLEFVVGPAGGCPIFDLRQTVTGAWLDGAALALQQVGHHDFGGGAGAQLRVLDVPLAAGSSHELRLTYGLGLPQASPAGSYPPALSWSAGPRLVFAFGFTDLGAGRYLEAWVPANLIFDQFGLVLEVRVQGTTVPHSVITNGAAASMSANRWSIAFPDRFTALSPMLEVRATDTLASATSASTLPVSGASVTVEAWRLAAGTVDLTAEISRIQGWLSDNELSTGPYPHGPRFVAFVNTGGMEYDGGTTSGPGALRHETFHSWWGRGVKPASQQDGWWDEAWNVYNDLGASGSDPFDFTDPPVELSSRNPWTRTTPSGAYSAGERVFEGIASLLGVAAIRSLMGEFYRARQPGLATTADLEAFLVSRSGVASLVNAFHRFVYGFPDPSPAPDLWIKDDPGDPGGDFWAGTFWNSPDLWIRHADDGGTAHQPVQHGWTTGSTRECATGAPAVPRGTSSSHSTCCPGPGPSWSTRATCCPASPPPRDSISAPVRRQSCAPDGQRR